MFHVAKRSRSIFAKNVLFEVGIPVDFVNSGEKKEIKKFVENPAVFGAFTRNIMRKKSCFIGSASTVFFFFFHL